MIRRTFTVCIVAPESQWGKIGVWRGTATATAGANQALRMPVRIDRGEVAKCRAFDDAAIPIGYRSTRAC